MMNRFAPIAALLASLVASLAPAQSSPATQPVTLPRSEQFDLAAPGGRPYRISIAAPAEPVPAGGYAVLYVLDANAMFATAAEAVRFQQGNVPCVVVGVGYPQEKLDQARRYLDFTPHTSAQNLAIRRTTPGTEGFVDPSGTGGQEPFFAFLNGTLRPLVAARFKLDPARQALFGHSLAGRFVLHTLATHPDAFNYYLAASPSIWWDGESVVGEIEQYLKWTHAVRPAGVLITVGEFEQKFPPGTPPTRAEFFARAKMVDNARAMADRLKSAGLNATFIEYADENHGTVVPMALSRGVRFSFRAATPATRPSR